MWYWKIFFYDSDTIVGEGLSINKIIKRNKNFWDSVEKVVFFFANPYTKNSLVITEPFTLVKRWKYTVGKEIEIDYNYVIRCKNKEIILYKDGNFK